MQSLLSSSALDDYLFASEAQKLILRKKIERLFLQTIKDFESYHSIRFIDSEGRAPISTVGKFRRRETVNFKHETLDAPDAAHPISLKTAIGLYRRLESVPLVLSSGYMEWFIPPREIQIEGPFVDESNMVSSLAGMAKLDLDTGLFGGVLMIHQNLDPFFAYLREVTFFDENPIWVFDAQSRVLQQPDNAQATFDPRPALPQTFQGNVELLDRPEGLVAYQDFAIVPGQPFIRIAVSLPSALLLKDLSPAIRFFSITLLVSLIIVCLVALSVSSYLSKPIIELAAAASRLANGDLSTQVAVRTTGEVQVLVDSFNQMTTNLHDTISSRDASMASLRNEVAERLRAERALKQQAKALIEARVAAETANQAKSVFLANMSHELRTPLHGILGFARRGLKKAATASPDTLHGYFAQIDQSGGSLLVLLNDLLDLAKLEAGKTIFQFEPANLDALLGMVVDEFRSLVAERQITVQYHSPDMVPDFDFDAGKITQVARNLLSNAVKFSPEEGDITIALQIEPQIEPQTAVVTIEDQGPGIPADELDTVFDKFVQSSATVTGAGGTGLGLAISREIITAHGGRIWAETRPEGGAMFCFTLPMQRQAEAQTPAD